MFEYAQGHANAFGISIDDALLRRFHEYANEALAGINFGENVYSVNFVRDANSEDLHRMILDIGAMNGIWGQHNPEPLIYITPTTLNPANISVMGANKDTIKFTINGIDYIKFHATDLINELQSIQNFVKIEMVCKANINEWMGRLSPQMMIEDYEINEIQNQEFNF